MPIAMRLAPRALWVPLILVSFMRPARVDAQTPSAGPPEPATPGVTVLYTGRLLGYFRVPDAQPAQLKSCPDPSAVDGKPSPPVHEFLEQAKKEKNTILVSTGDTFAPEFLSRIFMPAPNVKRPGKDRYNWDWGRQSWLPGAEILGPVSDVITAGRGWIPTDNVGCFLVRAGFDAVVPGKHDFYFGPERLRQLARFLATAEPRPVQMLAANLVIQTTYVKSPQPAYPATSRFLTTHPVLQGMNVKDGDVVFPWLQRFRVRTGELEIKGAHLCETSRNDPNDVPQSPEAHPDTCPSVGAVPQKTDKNVSKDTPEQVISEFALHNRDQLKPGHHYALCLKAIAREGESSFWCVRFSVHQPFFLYPNDRPHAKDASHGYLYADPEPYLLVPSDGGDPKATPPVAVFGVVDPLLREHIGELNFSWWNDNKDYTTEIGVVDPVVALEQLLQYFERKYRDEHDGNDFRGLKVLLAQMDSPKARKLAAQMKGQFQVVISEAQMEYVTPAGTSVVTSPDDRGPTFVVTPPPYYDPFAHTSAVRVRSLNVTRPSENQWRFDVTAKEPHTPQPSAPTQSPEKKSTLCDNERFLGAIKERFVQLRIPAAEVQAWYKADHVLPLRRLTLSALQRSIGSDVALIQKRDFFCPALTGVDVTADMLQEVLDRSIWKGDFVSKLALPGSILQKVLERSKQFDAEDDSALSLTAETGRGVDVLGVYYDKKRKEYLVKGVALDPGRLYTVATTDYLSLGDTGYPDVLVDGLGNPRSPRDFSGPLDQVSSVLCRDLTKVPRFEKAACTESIDDARGYFDRSTQAPPLAWKAEPNPRATAGTTSAARPQSPSPPPFGGSTFEDQIQNRVIWKVALEKGSAGWSVTHHKLSEQERDNRFGGLTTAQITAPRSGSLDLDVKPVLARESRYWDWFGFSELRDLQEKTYQTKGPPVLNQKKNVLAIEGGGLLHRSKRVPRWNGLAGVRFETQLVKPTTSFKLGTGDRLTVSQDKSRTLVLQLGARLQTRKSSIEGGYQIGKEFNAITQYVFNAGTLTEAECEPTAATSVAECVADKSTTDDPRITPDSSVRVDRQTRPRRGWFVNAKAVFAITPKVSYTTESETDFFLTQTRRPTDNSTDTRYQVLWKNAIAWSIMKNLAFEPKIDLFFFENKVALDKFWQMQSSINLNYTFEWFSGNRPGDALGYKPGGK